MKYLKFKDFKCRWVMSGSKWSTIRVFDDKNISVGDELQLINADTGEIFAYAKVTQVTEKPLCDIGDEDMRGHERYNNFPEMLQSFRSFYGDKVKSETPAKIIQFRLIK
jgi:hypothetical protein